MEFNPEVMKEFVDWMETVQPNFNFSQIKEYMTHFLDAVYRNGIKSVEIDDKVYEVYADIVETKE